MSKCRLCKKERILCNSHIVPEFLYEHLYKDNKLAGITGLGNKGWKPLQKGLREHLLCFDCEQHLNDEYEKPFLKQWTVDFPLPESMTQDSVHVAVYDYTRFKLFHLSILFRSSVSSLPTFNVVNLGAHEDRIRQMLLSGNPGYDSEYPIIACAVLNKQSKVERRLISCPFTGRPNGHFAYGQIYGGAVWWVSVSSHRNDLFCGAGLQRTGDITIPAVPLREMAVVQAMSKVLNRVHL